MRPLSSLDPAVAMRLALDLEALDQRKHEIGRAGAETVQRLAPLAAELRDHFLRIELEPGDDLAAIAPGSAKARLLGLEQHGLHPAFREMQRRGEPAEAPADDDGLGGDVLPQLGEAWSRRGRLVPQTEGARPCRFGETHLVQGRPREAFGLRLSDLR
jgi:hypothetical protein